MRASISRTWKKLNQGRPGHRFRERYRRNQKAGKSRNWLKRLVRFVAAAAAFAIGVVLVFIPGPAIVFFLIAGALLASDWLWVARFLDWSEVRLRAAWRRLHKFWRGLPVAGRVAVAAGGAMLSVASTYGVYQLMH